MPTQLFQSTETKRLASPESRLGGETASDASKTAMHNVEKLMNAAKGNRHGQRNAPRRLRAWATSGRSGRPAAGPFRGSWRNQLEVPFSVIATPALPHVDLIRPNGHGRDAVLCAFDFVDKNPVLGNGHPCRSYLAHKRMCYNC